MGSVVRAAMICALVLCSSASAVAAEKTDVIVLINGDRLTGEIIDLQKGQLEFKTDHEGTIDVEWSKIVQIRSINLFEIVTSEGRRFLGSLGQADPGFIVVVGSGDVPPLAFDDVTRVVRIGKSFWKKLDGSFSGGFNYTKSSGVAQTNLSSDTVYRQPAFWLELQAAATLTYKTEENTHTDQASLEFSYVRNRRRRLLLGAAGKLETNESLGLTLRSQAVATIGYRLVNSNRAQMLFGGGVAVNNEQGVDTEATQNIEGTLGTRFSYFKYSHPKTNFDTTLTYYPSLSDWGRQRLQVNSDVNHEVLRNFYVGFTAYDNFDSAPPNASAAHNDFGVVISVSWTYGR